MTNTDYNDDEYGVGIRDFTKIIIHDVLHNTLRSKEGKKSPRVNS